MIDEFLMSQRTGPSNDGESPPSIVHVDLNEDYVSLTMEPLDPEGKGPEFPACLTVSDLEDRELHPTLEAEQARGIKKELEIYLASVEGFSRIGKDENLN